MKKFLLSIIIALTVISAASARDFRVLTLGAKAGVNLSSVSGLSDYIGSIKPNFTGGIHFEFRPIKWVGLSAELLYTGSGFETKPMDDLEQMNVKFNFIDIPIMARIYVAGGLSLNVGVQASFLFSPSFSIGEMRAMFEEDKALFSIPVGVSYSFNFGLIIEARYNIALSKVLPSYSIKTTHGSIDTPNLRSENLAFTVAWRIFSF